MGRKRTQPSAVEGTKDWFNGRSKCLMLSAMLVELTCERGA
ncbi:MAG: hypothetical protein ACTS7I_01530 [Candidatus Hodgkinia cicadicola]